MGGGGRGGCIPSKKGDLLSHKFLFVPINKDAHWFLLCVYNFQGCLQGSGECLVLGLDSRGSDAGMSTAAELVKKFLIERYAMDAQLGLGSQPVKDLANILGNVNSGDGLSPARVGIFDRIVERMSNVRYRTEKLVRSMRTTRFQEIPLETHEARIRDAFC